MNNILIRKIGDLTRKKVVVFGTGGMSELVSKLPIRIDYYVDNDQKKWGKQINGVNILNPEVLKNEEKGNVVIIIASMFFDEISNQLESYFFVKDEDYFNLNELIEKYALELTKKSNIEQFKNVHEGKRAFIIGNGPSLKISDLERLSNEITFAANRIYLAFNDTDWRPTYYSVIDNLIAKNHADEIKSLRNMTTFFAHNVYKHLGEVQNAYWLRHVRVFDELRKRSQYFSQDLVDGICDGGTVTYAFMQIAYYMGIREIYLLGVDFSYPGLREVKLGERTLHTYIDNGQQTHFYPNYFTHGEQIYLPVMELQYQSYLHAFNFFQRNNVKIYNASRQTALDVFPRVDLDEIL